MAYFDGIKVGDTVWVAGIGWIDVGRVSARLVKYVPEVWVVGRPSHER